MSWQKKDSTPTSISNLTDVDVTNKTNGYGLLYDSTLGKIKLSPLPTGGGGGTSSVNAEMYMERTFFDFDFGDMYRINATSPLSIPFYANPAKPTNNSVVHPSMLYFENGWNGYQYWAAINPYPGTNSGYENPCIFCSHDGINWVQPAGIVNPIDTPQTPTSVGTTGGSFSDVHLFRDADGVTVHLLNRQYAAIGNDVHIYKYQSTDGVNWTNKMLLLYSSDYSTVEDWLSPCVIYDNGIYKMFSVDDANQKSTGVYGQLKIYTAPKPEGPWSKMGIMNVPVPSGRETWHLEVRNLGGLYVCVFNSFLAGGTTLTGGQLHIAKSYDMQNWTTYSYPLLGNAGSWEVKGFYKSSFLLGRSEKGFKLKLWYGAMITATDGGIEDWRIGFTDVLLEDYISDDDISTYNRYSKRYIGGDIKKEDFNSGLGTFWDSASTTAGYTLSPKPSNIINILSTTGWLRYFSKTYNYIVNVRLGDVTVGQNGFAGIMIRQDVSRPTSEYYIFGINGGSTQLWSPNTGGTVLFNKMAALDMNSGDLVTIVCYEKDILVFINNRISISYTNLPFVGDLGNLTGVGFYANSTDTKFEIDSFEIMTPSGLISTTAGMNQQFNNDVALNIFKAKNGMNDALLVDDFNRTGSTIGTSLDGKTWNIVTGTFSTQSDYLKASTNPALGTVDLGNSNFDFILDTGNAANGQHRLIFNYIDSQNYFAFAKDSGVRRIFKGTDYAFRNISGGSNDDVKYMRVIKDSSNGLKHSIYFGNTKRYDLFITPASWVGSAWMFKKSYALNDIVCPSVDNGFYYICTTAGTSSAYEPNWITTVGVTITDGTVTWTAKQIGKWAAYKSYNVGDYVVPTTANNFFYECTIAGTSGITEPTWSTTSGASFTDNASITWTVRQISSNVVGLYAPLTNLYFYNALAKPLNPVW